MGEIAQRCSRMLMWMLFVMCCAYVVFVCRYIYMCINICDAHAHLCISSTHVLLMCVRAHYIAFQLRLICLSFVRAFICRRLADKQAR